MWKILLVLAAALLAVLLARIAYDPWIIVNGVAARSVSAEALAIDLRPHDVGRER